MEDELKFGIVFVLLVILGCVLFFGSYMAFMPKYRVWNNEMKGKAEYAQAEQNRKIKILEAEAKRESAKLEAEAEIERAKGVQQANEIIAEGLKDNEEYLRYLWIQGLQTNEMQVLYIPTEAGLPILEAGQR